jgi:hypothetical protein
MDEEMPADHSIDNVVRMFPSPETLDDWKAYIAEATEMEQRADQSKVEAIVEKGRRIAEFHAAYKANGQKWGTRWSDVCQEIIGINDSGCAKYELIAKNIRPDRTDICFPSARNQLYDLARAISANVETFNKAASAGEITSKTTPQKAEAIRREAEAKPPKPRQEIRRHPKTGVPVWGKYNRPVIIPSKKTLAERRKPQPMLTIPMRDVTERLGPIIKRLKQQGKCSMATVSFATLLALAGELEHLVEEWTSGETGI